MKINNSNKLLTVMIIFIFLTLNITTIANAFLPRDQSKIFFNNFYRKNFQDNDESNVSYELLIIAPKEFKKSLQPLLNHKNKMGLSTTIVTLDIIYSSISEGFDEAEKVKYYIKQAKEEWNITYVLLVGGKKSQFSVKEEWWLPVRYVQVFVEYWEDSESFISDLYYADIYDKNNNFSSWDTNQNNIFGEWLNNGSQDKYIDLIPDVYVGRLPCRNKIEVKTIVNKIINYEKEKCSESWFKKMVVAAGDAITQNDINDGEVETQKALEYMSNFDHVRLWASRGTLTSQRDVIKKINAGCGFLYLNGHGTPASWSTHPPKDNMTWIIGLDIYHIPLLRNGEKLPICIVDGCWCSKFNVSFLSPLYDKNIPVPIYECLSWRLTRKIGGGAIATIGNTGLGYPAACKINQSKGGGNDFTGILFFQEYGENGTDNLGKIWGKVIEKYLEYLPINWKENDFTDTSIDLKTIEQWMLMGDPSLKIGGYPSDSMK